MFCSINRYEVVYKILLPAGKVPEGGVVVKDIRGGDDIHLSKEMLGTILIMTIADFCDQMFG